MNKITLSAADLILHMKWLWRKLSHHWVIKVFCLIMAFVVWQTVRENTSFEVVVADVPVDVTVADGLAVLDQSVKTVSVRFRGSREDTRFISNDRIQVKIDLSDATHRTRQVVRLSPGHVKVPSRAHAVQFSPSELIVSIDREVERVLPVKAVFKGDLPQGVHLDKMVCSPATVNVRGAEKLLSDLEQVRTIPIDWDGRRVSFKTYVAIVPEIQPWVIAPDHVTVEAILVEHVETRRFENREVRPLLASDDTRSVKIRPEKVMVILRGSPQQLAELSERDVFTYIDCTELMDPAEYEVAVRADFPAGLHLEKIEPAAVHVTVRKR
ncbi:MAG: hypothetical protein FJ220_05805 [Kiritimatiellaceae bacterium]|nr:hypothetical protein [Kiritimatiellaceae bacterium]